jgi:hypothetical protein
LQDGGARACITSPPYVKRSTFSEGRLLDYDQSGRIVLRYRDSADGKLRSQALDPFELIRHWLLDPFAPAQSGLRPALRRSVSLASRRLGSTRLRRPPRCCLRTDVSHPKKSKGVRVSVKSQESPRKLLTAFQDPSKLASSRSRVLSTAKPADVLDRTREPNSYSIPNRPVSCFSQDGCISSVV